MHGIYTDVLTGVCTQTFCAWCYQWRQDGSAAGAVWAAKVGYRPFRFYSVTENWNAWLLFACLTFVWPCGLLELWTVSSVLHLRKITVIPAVWSAAGISARSVTLHTVHCRPDPFNWKFRFPTTSLCWWFTNSRLLSPWLLSPAPADPVDLSGCCMWVDARQPATCSSIRQRRKSCGARHHVDNTRYRQPLSVSVSVPTQLLQRLLSVIWASTLTVISPWEPRLHGRLQAALLCYASFAASAARYQIRCFSHWLCHWYWQSQTTATRRLLACQLINIAGCSRYLMLQQG